VLHAKIAHETMALEMSIGLSIRHCTNALFTQLHRHINKERERHTDRQRPMVETDTQSDRQTDRQTDGRLVGDDGGRS